MRHHRYEILLKGTPAGVPAALVPLPGHGFCPRSSGGVADYAQPPATSCNPSGIFSQLLCLSETLTPRFARISLARKAQPCFIAENRKGRAFPHKGAAKPHTFQTEPLAETPRLAAGSAAESREVQTEYFLCDLILICRCRMNPEGASASSRLKELA